ncbi:signal recognition particle receptor beta subunit-domain-containing protein [Crassisporium funariophilum]|nr:signal recognition particle receptor beta subunit-domain-containing protein [Crassisporium funariophilum]
MERDGLPHKTPEVLPLSLPFTSPILGLAALLVASFLLAVIFLLNKKKSTSRGSAFLLVGPPDAGKTAILSQLVYSQTMPTQISMQTNTSIVTLPSKKAIKLIDVPGHPRLRDQFQEHLADTKVVGFVVDTSTVSRNAPAVAEHLHYILHALTSLPPSQPQPSLLILAHKSDLLKTSSSSPQAGASTLAVNRVKTILERELEKRRVSQSGGINIEGLGEDGERSDMGGLECSGKEGSTFRFDEWEGGEILFLGTSVFSNASQVEEKAGNEDSLRDWLEENM